MTRITSLEAQPFGDGVYRLALTETEIFEIETGLSRTGGGQMSHLPPKPMPVFELFAHIMSGRVEAESGTIGSPFRSGASMANICNVVRLGLIGGGMSASDARALVAQYSPPHRPLQELWDIAAAVLYAALVGIEATADG